MPTGWGMHAIRVRTGNRIGEASASAEREEQEPTSHQEGFKQQVDASTRDEIAKVAGKSISTLAR